MDLTASLEHLKEFPNLEGILLFGDHRPLAKFTVDLLATAAESFPNFKYIGVTTNAGEHFVEVLRNDYKMSDSNLLRIFVSQVGIFPFLEADVLQVVPPTQSRAFIEQYMYDIAQYDTDLIPVAETGKDFGLLEGLFCFFFFFVLVYGPVDGFVTASQFVLLKLFASRVVLDLFFFSFPPTSSVGYIAGRLITHVLEDLIEITHESFFDYLYSTHIFSLHGMVLGTPARDSSSNLC